MSEADSEFEWTVDSDFLTLAREKVRAAIRKLKERRLSGRLDTSDLVQESMLEVSRSINNFRGKTEAEFDGWLKSIASHMSQNASRHHHAKKRDISQETAGIEGLLSGGQAPDAQLERAELLERLANALEQIDEREQEVVMQHMFEKLSFVQIADERNCSAGTISKLFKRALSNIKRLMEQPRTA